MNFLQSVTLQGPPHLVRQVLHFLQTFQQVQRCALPLRLFLAPLHQHHHPLHGAVALLLLDVVHIVVAQAQEDGHLLPLLPQLIRH